MNERPAQAPRRTSNTHSRCTHYIIRRRRQSTRAMEPLSKNLCVVCNETVLEHEEIQCTECTTKIHQQCVKTDICCRQCSSKKDLLWFHLDRSTENRKKSSLQLDGITLHDTAPCPICLYEITPTTAYYLKCGHCLHINCSKKMKNTFTNDLQSRACPICRQQTFFELY